MPTTSSANPTATRVLVIEDNEPVRRFVTSVLGESGFGVDEAGNGREAYQRLRSGFYDLVLLDLKLGDLDGMDILRTIRRQDEHLPVIILSSIEDLNTKIGGFDVGCDDYITQPFQPAELVGRIRRLLRRSWNTADPEANVARQPIAERIEAGPFTLDLPQFCVYKHGRPIQMRKKVFGLLLHMARNPNVVLTKESLIRRVWDFREDVNDNTLYVHIHQLRQLIEDDPTRPRFVRTVRGVGFRFEIPGD